MPKIPLEDLMPHIVRFTTEKERIQKEFDNGLTLAAFAARENIAKSTASTVLTGIGVNYTSRFATPKSRAIKVDSELLGILIDLVNQLCIRVGVNIDRLKSHLSK